MVTSHRLTALHCEIDNHQRLIVGRKIIIKCKMDRMYLPTQTCLPFEPSPRIRILPILIPLQHALNAFSMLSPLMLELD